MKKPVFKLATAMVFTQLKGSTLKRMSSINNDVYKFTELAL